MSRNDYMVDPYRRDRLLNSQWSNLKLKLEWSDLERHIGI